MSEEEKINQPTKDSPPLTEENKAVAETSSNNKKPITNMEVHHHPHVEKKNFKEYFLEFLMIFLAVTMGFFAENVREYISNKEKENKYIIGIVRDLKLDTAEASSMIILENGLLSDMRSALQIPTEQLDDLNKQDSFYYHFLHFFVYEWQFARNENTLVQLKNTGGFSIIQKENVADSIIAVSNNYDFLKQSNEFYHNDFLRVEDFTSRLIKVPVLPTDTNGFPVLPQIVSNTEVFTQYDKPLLEQLYSLIKIEKIELESTPKLVQDYKDKATGLLLFLQKEYHLQNQ